MNFDHEHIKELLPAHALGALRGDDARVVDEHIEQCAECRIEFEAACETSAMLAYAAGDAVPSPELRAQILSRVHHEAGTPSNVREFRMNASPTSVGRRSNVFALIAATIAIAAVLISLFLWQKTRQQQAQLATLSAQADQQSQELTRMREENEILMSPSARVTTLSGTNAAVAARGRLVVDQDSGRALLFANNLPSAPKGKAYQLWFIADGKPIPGKTFSPDQRGSAVLRDEVPTSARHANLFAVTLEPEQGVAAPTGEKYLLGAGS